MRRFCCEAGCFGRTLPYICRALDEDGETLYASFAEMLEGGMDAERAWTAAYEASRARGGRAAWINDGDRDALKRIVTTVATSSREQTRAGTERMIEALEERWKEAEEACGKKAGLFTTLGALIGAMAAILIW